MKKIVILIAVLIPVFAFSQHSKTAKEVFDMFYSDNYYSYFEVSSDLLKDIISMNNIDKDKKEQLSKIKVIRMMELDTAGVAKAKKKYEETAENPYSLYNKIHYDYSRYSNFFKTFTINLKTKPYKTLVLYKKKGNSKMFLKRVVGDSTVEYLLVTDYYAIQLIGDLNFKTVSELQEIVSQLSEMSF